MSNVKQFTIGDKSYNAGMASAVQQDELLSLLSLDLIARTFTSAAAGEATTDATFVPMFMSMNQQLKKQVVNILAGRVVLDGTTDQRITVADFSGKMVEWNKLLSQLLVWNLEGFFVWLADAVKDVQPPQAADPAP